MIESLREFSSSPTSMISEHCQKLVLAISNQSEISSKQPIIPPSFIQLLSQENLTLNSLRRLPDCVDILTNLISQLNHTLSTNKENSYSFQHSKSLIVFVILIGLVSLISILGNLCLVKVLCSKRHHWNPTDRIVTCLALSELCLVLLDSPMEIYRLLTPSFTQEWLCPSHTFFEAFFSSCIIFYHLLGAFDRFVYIHGHTSLRRPFWSKWFRQLSTKTSSMLLLIFPLLFSFPLAICNCLYTSIVRTSSGNQICVVQYAHGTLIALLISFYLCPLLFAFFLHGKLIYFIRSRHNQYYFTPTAYILSTKRNETIELQSRRRIHRNQFPANIQLLSEPKGPSHRSKMMTTTEILPSTTTTTLPGRILPNQSSNSSQSSRSSTGTTSTTSPVILYKINSRANTNANRTVLLLVLLLSFYVFCWAPYNIYTWRHAYLYAQSSSSNVEYLNMSSMNESRRRFPLVLSTNLHADLRRIIYINYSLYLLSMISMCFSFIFYFSLNKQARNEFSHFIGCICPWWNSIGMNKRRSKQPKTSRQIAYHPRTPHQYPQRTYRMKNNPSPPSLFHESPTNISNKRRMLNYGCQVQCCP